MNLNRVFLEPEVWKECRDYGKRVVEAYQNNRAPRSAAMVVPNRPRITYNEDIQAWGKAFECALCLWANHPLSLLSWTARPDNGIDVEFWGRKIDMKGSKNIRSNCLIWPQPKNHILKSTPSDTLVLGRRALEIEPPAIDLLGWTPKDRFINFHLVAPAVNNRKFADGTKYLEEHQLLPMEDMRAWAAI